MSLQSNIVDYVFSDEYIQIFLLASQYSVTRWDKSISEEDIFFAVVNILSRSKTLKSMLKNTGFDIERIIDIYRESYKSIKIPASKKMSGSFVLSTWSIKIIEKTKQMMDDYKDKKMFFLYILISILSLQDIKISTDLYKNWINVQTINKKLMMLITRKIDNVDKDYNEMIKILKDLIETINVTNRKIEKIEKDIEKFEDYDDITDDDVIFPNEINFSQDIKNTDKWDMRIDLDEMGNSNNENKKDSNEDDINIDETKKLSIWLFAVNITKEAKNWKLDPTIWREKVIEQLTFTLLRKTKNNPMLIWEAWVWKTAIVEWLAQRIVSWNVPERLKWKQLYMLDMGSLVAGTKFRWEFEARLKTILQEVADPTNNIILFIDEIHTVIWAWNVEWWADTANILKPFLARWKIKLIWATTWDEYRKYIEKDAALKRRFQEIVVGEPSMEETQVLIRWIAHKYEDFHWVVLTDEAIEKAVKLSTRYMLDKHLPDKAIDLVDEACVRRSIWTTKVKFTTEYYNLKQKVKDMEIEMAKKVMEQDYFSAADLKSEIDRLNKQILDMMNISNIPHDQREQVSAHDVTTVVSEKLSIPISNITSSEIESLKSFDKTLKSKILWQDDIVEKVVKAIIRNRLSISERNKPIASFLFLWPSWVWKTYMAKLLAQEYFHDTNALIRLDMSEYMEKINASKLIWSAPWYVWYDQWWVLTEAVRRKPYSVVLFDEIEKASPEVLNILLQILDEWELKDNKWNKIDFKNTIIILTSNIWSEEFEKDIASVWFAVKWNKIDDSQFDVSKERALETIKNLLPLELLNRFDYILAFKPLTKLLLEQIFEQKYIEFADLWKKKKWITIPKLTSKQIKQRISKLYKPELWARCIEKYIYNELETDIIYKNILNCK